MRIAIPIWEDKLSPVLDTASRLLILEMGDGGKGSRFETYLEGEGLTGRCYRIRNLKIDVLICGAISRPFLTMLTAAGVETITGISGRAEDVLEAYFQGNLSHAKFLLPGCKYRRAQGDRQTPAGEPREREAGDAGGRGARHEMAKDPESVK